jgi:hypothetical protein
MTDEIISSLITAHDEALAATNDSRAPTALFSALNWLLTQDAIEYHDGTLATQLPGSPRTYRASAHLGESRAAQQGLPCWRCEAARLVAIVVDCK